MATSDINFINLIVDLKKAGRSNKEEISSILYRYDIPKIESLERRVLEFVFSVNDDAERFKLVDMVVEANNLPIIHECYCIITSSLSKEEYISCQVKNIGRSRSSFGLKYEICVKIISQSFLLQKVQKAVFDFKEQMTNENGIKVISHRYRNRAASRN